MPSFGPKGGHIEGVDKHVSEGDCFKLSGIEQEINVLETPGHTLDHLTYVCDGHVFCGDTLFSAGCGRPTAPRTKKGISAKNMTITHIS